MVALLCHTVREKVDHCSVGRERLNEVRKVHIQNGIVLENSVPAGRPSGYILKDPIMCNCNELIANAIV